MQQKLILSYFLGPAFVSGAFASLYLSCAQNTYQQFLALSSFGPAQSFCAERCLISPYTIAETQRPTLSTEIQDVHKGTMTSVVQSTAAILGATTVSSITTLTKTVSTSTSIITVILPVTSTTGTVSTFTSTVETVTVTTTAMAKRKRGDVNNRNNFSLLSELAAFDNSVIGAICSCIYTQSYQATKTTSDSVLVIVTTTVRVTSTSTTSWYKTLTSTIVRRVSTSTDSIIATIITTLTMKTTSTLSLDTITTTVEVTATTTIGFPYQSTGPYDGCALNSFSDFEQYTGDDQFEDAVQFCQESFCNSDPNCDFVYVQFNYADDSPNTPAYYCYKNESPYTFDPANSQDCGKPTGVWGSAYAYNNNRSPNW